MTIQQAYPLPPAQQEWSTIRESLQAFEATRACFVQAAKANVSAVRRGRTRVAGRTVQVDCVGERLAEYILAPLILNGEGDEFAPRLRIKLWDIQATGIAPPDSGERDLSRRFWELDHGRFVCHVQPHSTTWFDRQRSEIVGWITSARCTKPSERAKPLLPELSMWLAMDGIIGAHAGLVGREGDGVLLAGKGGSGKTTCALSCLRAGFEFLGDDHVWLEQPKHGPFLGHGLYRSTALWPDHAVRFEDVSLSQMQDVPPTDRPKPCFVLSSQFRSSFRSLATVRAVLVPHVGNQSRTKVSPISKGAALLAIAPHSLIARYPVSTAVGLETLGRLVEQTPCWSIQLGHTLEQIPLAIDEILKGATGRA